MEVAKRSGFVLWDNCHWKPEFEVVDWSCSYDNELQEFLRQVVLECCTVIPEHAPRLRQYWKI